MDACYVCVSYCSARRKCPQKNCKYFVNTVNMLSVVSFFSERVCVVRFQGVRILLHALEKVLNSIAIITESFSWCFIMPHQAEPL